MKKLILFLACLFFGFGAKAQDGSIFTQPTIEECVAAVDSLFAGASRKYEFIESFSVGSGRYALDYREKNPSTDSPKKLRVIVSKLVLGGNPDLEIEGTTVFRIRTISGQYLDIFPIWKEYADPDADIDAISQKGRTEDKRFETDPNRGVDYCFKPDKSNPGIWIFERSEWYIGRRN